MNNTDRAIILTRVRRVEASIEEAILELQALEGVHLSHAGAAMIHALCAMVGGGTTAIRAELLGADAVERTIEGVARAVLQDAFNPWGKP